MKDIEVTLFDGRKVLVGDRDIALIASVPGPNGEKTLIQTSYASKFGGEQLHVMEAYSQIRPQIERGRELEELRRVGIEPRFTGYPY